MYDWLKSLKENGMPEEVYLAGFGFDDVSSGLNFALSVRNNRYE